MHLDYIDWVLELEYALANAHVLERPLPQSAIVGAGEEFANLRDSLEVVDLIRVTEEWDLRWMILTSLHRVQIPTTDETITVAREHQLSLCIAEEAERCDIVLDQEFLLVLRCVQGMIGAEILKLTI